MVGGGKVRVGDARLENELERRVRLEKVVTSKQFSLAMETEEERRVKLKNDAGTKRHRLAMETDKKEKQDWRRL